MIHFVFSEDDAAVLRKAAETEESMQGQIFYFSDDYSTGPLYAPDTETDISYRTNWMAEAYGLLQQDVETLPEKDMQVVQAVQQVLEDHPEEHLWIWMAHRSRDICGYYFLTDQLIKYQGRVEVIYLYNLPFIHAKGHLFFPDTLNEIPPREFLKARKLTRLLSAAEMETDREEWKRLISENATLRIAEGPKKIVSKAENYFDNEILKYLPSEWQKLRKAVISIAHKMKSKTNEIFITKRIQDLIQQGKIIVSSVEEGQRIETDIKKAEMKQGVIEFSASENKK
ncbi:MAG: DUF1835 domain-containing protein [Chitinophagaceae bacterium]|nr:DUF1835 domain-containing protein [Chitinophagaceae bacterium]